MPGGGGLLAVAGDNLQHRTVWRPADGRHEAGVPRDSRNPGAARLDPGRPRSPAPRLRARGPEGQGGRRVSRAGARRLRRVPGERPLGGWKPHLLLAEDSTTTTIILPTSARVVAYPSALATGPLKASLRMDGGRLCRIRPWVDPASSWFANRSGRTDPVLRARTADELLGCVPHGGGCRRSLLPASPDGPSVHSRSISRGATREPSLPRESLAVRGLLPDGSVLGVGGDGSLALYPLAGGDPRVLAWRLPRGPWDLCGIALQVGADGRSVYLREGCSVARVDRVEILTGRRVPWKTLRPGDRAGVAPSARLHHARRRAYAYSYGGSFRPLPRRGAAVLRRVDRTRADPTRPRPERNFAGAKYSIP